jgi:4-hydroxythreonine-4-phosphate dehydrogenase
MPTSNSDEAGGARDPGRAPTLAPGGYPPLAVTIGDPAGIGPDITLASWLQRASLQLPPFVVVGDPDVLADRAVRLSLAVPIESVADFEAGRATFAEALPVLPVRGAGVGGDKAMIVAAIEEATAAVLERRALGMVTNPITKSALNFAELAYPGHTEYLARLAERHAGGPRPRPVMMLVAEELKVVPATVHVPLTSVAPLLSAELLSETITITAAALTRDFGIGAPRIAVTGLNPHAGEDGLIGVEEVRLIRPIVAALAASGLAVSGPYAADTLFHAEARRGYDAVVAMYHDQALIPLKTLAFERGVNITLGLPFVRTSPDHGTAFAIAGTGKARPGSFIAALRLAAEVGHRRARASGAARR